MSLKFDYTRVDAPETTAELAAAVPDNPFYTPAYVAYRRLHGDEIWLLTVRRGEVLVTGCTAFVRTGKLARSVQIASVPRVQPSELFWTGLRDFCRDIAASLLSLDSFGSPQTDIPPFPRELSRRTRREFILDLPGEDLFRKMRKGHVYNVKRCAKSGVTVSRTSDPTRCADHARLINLSMDRRKDRGELVSSNSHADQFTRILETEAGVLYQAWLEGEIISSNLILVSETAGYNQTQGSSPVGMQVGAPHFLLHAIGQMLRSEGKLTFNLGGTDDLESGLARFKSGFGASTRIVDLQAVDVPLCARFAGAVWLALNRIGL